MECSLEKPLRLELDACVNQITRIELIRSGVDGLDSPVSEPGGLKIVTEPEHVDEDTGVDFLGGPNNSSIEK